MYKNTIYNGNIIKLYVFTNISINLISTVNLLLQIVELDKNKSIYNFTYV